MKDASIDIYLNINHLIDSSKDDQRAMYALYDAKSFSWALFIGHIYIEKYLKTLYLQ